MSGKKSRMGPREQWAVSIRHGTNYREAVWKTAYVGGKEAAKAAFETSIDANPDLMVILLDNDGKRFSVHRGLYGEFGK